MNNTTENIALNLKAIQQRIHDIERSCNRQTGAVTLLAVSKQQSVDAITTAFKAGQYDFGENYLQEALIKMQTLHDLPICWHFIGRIQRNKVKAIAQHFQWVHTVSRIDIADALNAARPADLPPLNVCIQINIDNEATKTGTNMDEALLLATHIMTLPRLSLRGLMVIPKPDDDIEHQIATFSRIATYQAAINLKLHLSMDTLSMGMSHDFEAAIQAGSTIVRIGSAIFGARS